MYICIIIYIFISQSSELDQKVYKNSENFSNLIPSFKREDRKRGVVMLKIGINIKAGKVIIMIEQRIRSASYVCICLPILIVIILTLSRALTLKHLS